jgi:glutathione synthase/RimK-type ligase-like ATP-grasp enzyme
VFLVVTSKRDSHVHRVTPYIEEAGHQWIRVNTEDFPRNCSIKLDPETATGHLAFLDSGRRADLGEIRGVWYRKPDPFDLAHFELDSPSLEYVEAEFTEIVHGLYALLRGVQWINDPLTSRLSHRKLLQLRVAKEVGFRIPRSLVTNRIDDALDFAESVGWDIAIKSLSAISVTSHLGTQPMQYGVFTRRVTRDELLRTKGKIPHMPTLFQEYITKAAELRVTCVGDDVYCCRIYSQEGTLTKEDMRFDTRSLRHELIHDSQIEYLVRKYMRAFALNFGCFDIAVLQSGEPVFFECNPNGQWLWIEELTGAPIGKAIAQLLVRGISDARQTESRSLPVTF